MIVVKIINGKPQFNILVGHSFQFENKNIRIFEHDANTEKLKLAIDLYGNGADEVTEEISASLGIERFLNALKENYGLNIVLVDGFDYSTETKIKAQGLIQAGFTKLIKTLDNYTVDNTFLQNFLIQKELDYLLKENVEEILLSEIK